MQDQSQRLAYSIAELAALAGIGRTFLYEEAGAGRLIITKAGRRSIILHADAMAWLALLPKRAPDSVNQETER